MLKLSKILLPVDFSEQGAAAARYAGALTQHFRAGLTLLHVNPLIIPAIEIPREFSGPVDLGWVTALESRRRAELETFAEAEFRGVQVERVVVTGDPARKIVEYAHREESDLIVMPTHGYGPFRRFLLGSVTAKVLHDAECPVWTGAHLQETAHQRWSVMNHVLCAIDGGPQSETVLAWASNFAGEFNAKMVIVLAIPQFDPSDDLFDSEGFIRGVRVAEARIRCFLTKTGARGDVMVEEGEPAKVISELARRVSADLVVIGRSAAGGSGRLRANAYSIIRESPCPVVSV